VCQLVLLLTLLIALPPLAHHQRLYHFRPLSPAFHLHCLRRTLFKHFPVSVSLSFIFAIISQMIRQLDLYRPLLLRSQLPRLNDQLFDASVRPQSTVALLDRPIVSASSPFPSSQATLSHSTSVCLFTAQHSPCNKSGAVRPLTASKVEPYDPRTKSIVCPFLFSCLPVIHRRPTRLLLRDS
jgi:hypothetical protein